VNRRVRSLLHGEDYLWKQQAERIWKLPMNNEEWVTDVADLRGGGDGEGSCRGRGDAETCRPGLNRVQLLALARHPVPTEVDASIFAPCRWSRTLRSRTVVVLRGSLQKEMEVVPTIDPGRPAVRFLGRTGVGDRSVRANAPLPRPSQLLPKKRGIGWRNPFVLRRPGNAPTAPEAARTAGPANPTLPSARWQPFAIPTLVQSRPGRPVWNVAPRLVSYFEVELLPPSAAAAAATDPASKIDSAGYNSAAVSRSPASPSIWPHSYPQDRSDRLILAGIEALRSPVGSVRHSKECVAVGLATEDFALHTRMPGWDAHSWYVTWLARAAFSEIQMPETNPGRYLTGTLSSRHWTHGHRQGIPR
jgi:hypothetical protein